MDIGHELQALRKRIEDVERSARLSRASLDNTSIVVKDATGAVKGHIGMQTDGTVGLVTQDGPAPGTPTSPQVTSTIGGLAVTWDGALADGSALPADFDHIAVHVSTTSGFTPSAATFVGTITRSGDGGMLPVVPLPYQPHYVVLAAVNSSGIAGTPSTEIPATPLQVDGPDLKAGSVDATAITVGAVTADKLEAVLELVTRLIAGDPSGARVELNADGLRVYNGAGQLVIRFDSADGSAAFTGTITGSTITGGVFRTAASGPRITINDSNLNKILLYDSTGKAVGELSPAGLLVKGTTGAVLWLDPNNTYPALKFYNSAQTNSAVVNVSETTPGSADLASNSGTFTGSSFSDMKWRTFMGNDFAVIERIRDSSPNTYIGGRLDLRAANATIGYYDTTGANTSADMVFTPNVVRTRARSYIQPTIGDTNSVLLLQPGPSHTGYIMRYWDPDASVYRFQLDKAGNVDVGNILTAGNIAAGRITITPSAANTPTSANVTGLTLKGTTVRVVATASTTVPGSQVLGIGVSNQATTGFTVWLTRTNTTATAIDWIAYAL